MPKDGGFGVSKTLLFVNFLISFYVVFCEFYIRTSKLKVRHKI